ncbi:MAG: hypothetical protein BWY09_00223 [Candidatus Hydrogenedentes bacterium ADurb.Bin179]|nr:MAG: hypothetical protein BWY09_00223 [Candidatus Hydrogenedentes bacterium ADurb.Bin179]
MIPGYKPFFENTPLARVARVARVESEAPGTSPNHSNHSSTPNSDNAPVPETVIERSAIHEYEADMKRDRANMEASRAYDRNRQSYEFANPGKDPAGVEELYQLYISDWKPGGPDDLPPTPPNTRGNEDLWREWWAKVEAVKP